MHTKVGFATTSILEEIVKDYIDCHTVIKKCLESNRMIKEYIGNPKYLLMYSRLKTYNQLANESHHN